MSAVPRVRRRPRLLWGGVPALWLALLLLLVFLVTIWVGVFVKFVTTSTNSSSGNQEGENDVSGGGCLLAFVGDTMIANVGGDYALHQYIQQQQKQKADSGDDDTVDGDDVYLQSFQHVAPLIQECQHGIANLEGPISPLDISHDPWERTNHAYSFGMDPHFLGKLLRHVGITAVNRANNHLLDRGQPGIRDTDSYLARSNVPWFGKGLSAEEVLRPLLLDLDMSPSNVLQIAVTAFGPTRRAELSLPNQKKLWDGTLPVTREHVQLARRIMDDSTIKETNKTKKKKLLRVALVHWGENYGEVSTEMKDQARLLANEGKYDLILGSDGSHTVQSMEVIVLDETAKGASTSGAEDSSRSAAALVVYNIGNFVFSTPGRYSKYNTPGFGSIVQLHYSSARQQHQDDFELALQIHCTLIDNLKVKYIPQLCSPEESQELFDDILQNVPYTTTTRRRRNGEEKSASSPVAVVDLSRILSFK